MVTTCKRWTALDCVRYDGGGCGREVGKRNTVGTITVPLMRRFTSWFQFTSFNSAQFSIPACDRSY